MRIHVTCRKSIGSLLALLIVCGQQAPGRGQEPAQQTLLMSPAFGVGTHQRATFTLFLANGEPVRARVTLHDDQGRIVAESGEAEVRAGAFHSFPFDAGDIHMAGDAGTGRRQVRASCWIRVSQPWGKIGQFNAVLEITTVAAGVTDGTSNTFMIGEKLPRPLNGTVETILTRGSRDMLVGIAPGQSLRMSAFSADGSRPDTEKAQSIRMQVNVYDEDGTVVVTSREVEIAAGHFGSIDVDRRDLPMAGEPETGRARVRVKPLFAFPPVWNGRVVTSLEIVDTAGNTTSDPQCLVFFLGGTPGH